jgi:hypothetical protein
MTQNLTTGMYCLCLLMTKRQTTHYKQHLPHKEALPKRTHAAATSAATPLDRSPTHEHGYQLD